MIWRILKKLLAAVKLTVHYKDGDIVQIKLVYGKNVVLDKEFDIMKGV